MTTPSSERRGSGLGPTWRIGLRIWPIHSKEATSTPRPQDSTIKRNSQPVLGKGTRRIVGARYDLDTGTVDIIVS